KLGGQGESRGDLRERGEHRHRAAREETRVAGPFRAPPENLRDESFLARGSIFRREDDLPRDEAFEARGDREILRVSSAEIEVRRDTRPRQGLEEKREG